MQIGRNMLNDLSFLVLHKASLRMSAKKALLLASVGQDTYTTIKSVLSPVSPVGLPYIDLMARIGSHLAPKQSVILSRFKCNQYIQEPGQSAADYIANLKRLAENVILARLWITCFVTGLSVESETRCCRSGFWRKRIP